MILKIFIGSLFVYIVSVIISKKYILRDLKEDKNKYEWIFDLNVLSSYLSFIPILNTYYTITSVFEDVKFWIIYKILKAKLNKMAKKNGYKSFDDWHKFVKEKNQKDSKQ